MDLKTKYAIVFAVFKKDFYKSTFQMRKKKHAYV